ncbi:hypothetical protein IIA79_01200, partial [bacterium]|nr:hypothetical protein [bacterium]
FFSGEPVPGELAFAYTRRYFGPGASGPVDLLSVKITPLDHFTLSDFELDTSPGALIVRDSAKRELVVQVTRGGTP